MAVSELNLLVLRAKDPASLVLFYGKHGLSFVREQHGSGPAHHSCHAGGSIFEIYPIENDALGTSGTRLGFRVDSLTDTLAACDARLLSKPRQTASGKFAVIQDPEGHKIELLEARPRVA
jgi:lactoylglutathione lyase